MRKQCEEEEARIWRKKRKEEPAEVTARDSHKTASVLTG